jgi:hypothetical protein
MRLISHRANISGPDPKTENHPDQILKVLNKGIDCEIDVWRIDGNFYTGHDQPIYDIDWKFLCKPNLWVHAKNLEALTHLPNYICFFWHQNDDYTLISNNLIWTFPNKKVCDKSIIVHKDQDWKEKNYKCYGVCTDYPLY